ncbi:unnamed protein product [Withania somnifera]
MSEDMVIHFASNSSNQSDQSLPTKIAKLEARMAGKGSSVTSQANSWSGPAMFGAAENVSEPAVSSDSDDDDAAADTVKRIVENTETSKVGSDVNRRKQSCSRGQTNSGRGRGSRVSGHTRIQPDYLSNGQFDNSSKKLQDGLLKEQLGHNGQTASEEITSLRENIVALEEELKKSRQEATNCQHRCQELEKELKDLKDYEQQTKPKRTKIMSELLISVSKAERQEARMKVQQESLRLGNVGVIRAGTIISEAWEDGKALKDLNAQLRNLLETKEAIERQRKLLKKRQPDKSDGGDVEGGLQEEDSVIQDEIYRSRLASIKREEDMIMRERDRYELEKGRLIREMKRIRDEDGSRFNNFQILNHRYALLNLLGKGGFSEVYKAFDLVDHRYVACKLHGLNAQWSEDKKQSYIRHAIREYNIHKTLVHHHIVRLWDIFEIDHNTFCTVLEYCSGKDLDAVLKATPVLPEREARIIIVQIFQGLVYLNKKSQRIIHYDLKPGNVLFDEFGVAKVTDFGLSKIVEDDVGSQGMELTSQGAGTYWYLPPECFELSKTPLISSRVDVWSAGILLYQMLFGKRPFGHDQTQERILREDTIIKARKVEFPTRPAVSNEAKEFIRCCLTYNQEERPDVLTIAQDPYLTYTKK